MARDRPVWGFGSGDFDELYSAGAGRGLGDQDFAAVLEVVEDLNDTRL